MNFTKNYTPGTYTIKFDSPDASYIKGLKVFIDKNAATIDVLNWGENPSAITTIELFAVDKICGPETDMLAVTYTNGLFEKIPKNLFSKKKTTTRMSAFKSCEKLTEIPEGLFKKCVNAEDFYNTFIYCSNITKIPEKLFKYNTKMKQIYCTFQGTAVTEVPEDLLKYNTELENVTGMLYRTKLIKIPENLFKYNTNIVSFASVFSYTKITEIPENLIQTNTKINTMYQTFLGCRDLKVIPNSILEKAKTIASASPLAFNGCTTASNYNEIPRNLR